ncbi:MAG TPA: DUF2239 family protein [bacterium]|jgi:uncharacterized protein|nr:DUF2239 family protein [bacterium]
MENTQSFTAFAGDRLIASGELKTTLLATKRRLDKGANAPILIFDDNTGKQVDFDFRGTPEEVLARLSSHPLFAPAGPGRPKLGVTCREISLLPRHWEWLEKQPQGISAALRRLVEEAKQKEPDKERARMARDTAGKFMWAIAGNLPDFEEASRALYAMDLERFEKLIRRWPKDIRAHLRKLLGHPSTEKQR